MSMNKNIKLLLIVVLILFIGLVTWAVLQERNTLNKQSTVAFNGTGTLLFEGNEIPQPKGYFLQGGNKTELVFQTNTICAFDTGSLPCVAMSVTWDMAFSNKSAFVEGKKQDGKIFLDRIRVYPN